MAAGHRGAVRDNRSADGISHRRDITQGCRSRILHRNMNRFGIITTAIQHLDHRVIDSRNGSRSCNGTREGIQR